MNKKIQAILHSAGIFRHYYGYSYFQDAVLLAVECPDRLQSIRKEIYFPIAQTHHTTNVIKLNKACQRNPAINQPYIVMI